MEEEEETKEGEEPKPEVKRYCPEYGHYRCFFQFKWLSGASYLKSGWEEEKEDCNGEVLGLGISQWNETYLGQY